jgi:hypothetical protein
MDIYHQGVFRVLDWPGGGGLAPPRRKGHAQPRKLNLGRVLALRHVTAVVHASDSNNPPKGQREGEGEMSREDSGGGLRRAERIKGWVCMGLLPGRKEAMNMIVSTCAPLKV